MADGGGSPIRTGIRTHPSEFTPAPVETTSEQDGKTEQGLAERPAQEENQVEQLQLAMEELERSLDDRSSELAGATPMGGRAGRAPHPIRAGPAGRPCRDRPAPGPGRSGPIRHRPARGPPGGDRNVTLRRRRARGPPGGDRDVRASEIKARGVVADQCRRLTEEGAAIPPSGTDSMTSFRMPSTRSRVRPSRPSDSGRWLRSSRR